MMTEAIERVEAALSEARQSLEQALYELEKLPGADAGPDGFVVHALSDFLTVTGSTVELLRLSLAGHPDPQIDLWLGALQRATEVMTQMLRQLKGASSARDTTPRYEKVDLALMAQRFCLVYQHRADKKQIRIIAGSTADVPPAWTDRVLLSVVLENLLSNAVKYSPPGKMIWVQVSGDPAGVVCSVRDEGPGLSPEDQAQLFRRGVRLGPQPTGGEPSTGFGLAVAKEFLERLGGAIWCESLEGQGSCFSLRVPRYREQVTGAGSLPDPRREINKPDLPSR
jgi:signal transduction histidine kinase